MILINPLIGSDSERRKKKRKGSTDSNNMYLPLIKHKNIPLEKHTPLIYEDTLKKKKRLFIYIW